VTLTMGKPLRVVFGETVAELAQDDPRIVVLCVIDDPDKSRGHYGGAIAGPVVRDIIDYTLTYLGVEPDVGADHVASLAAAD